MKNRVLHDFLYALFFWAIISLFGFLVIHLFVMPYISGQYTEVIVVPDVTNMSEEMAISLLIEKNLDYQWDSAGQYSATVPKGSVMLQIPQSNKEVKAGRTIRLIVSKGLREVEVPELRGQSRRQGEITLNQLGLKIGQLIQNAHPAIPKGVIIRTIPESQTVVTIGASVDLVISGSNSSPTEMLPSVIGMSYKNAVALLDSLGFAIIKTTKSDSTSLPLTVLEQHPQSGEFLEKNSSVTIIIAE